MLTWLLFVTLGIIGFVSFFILVISYFYHFKKKLFDKRFYVTLSILLTLFVLSVPNIIFMFNDISMSKFKTDKPENITKPLKNQIFISKFSPVPQFRYIMNFRINIIRYIEILEIGNKDYWSRIDFKEYGGYKTFIEDTIKTQEYLCNKDKIHCYELIMLYFMNKDFDKVINNAEKSFIEPHRKHVLSQDNEIKKYKHTAYILKGEYENALKYADNFENERQKILSKVVCFTYLKQYNEALDYVKNLNGENDHLIKGFIYKRMGNQAKLYNEYNLYKITTKYLPDKYEYKDFIKNINNYYEFEYEKNIQNLIEYKKQNE